MTLIFLNKAINKILETQLFLSLKNNFYKKKEFNFIVFLLNFYLIKFVFFGYLLQLQQLANLNKLFFLNLITILQRIII